jgi:outer membrane protein insertion porin family
MNSTRTLPHALFTLLVLVIVSAAVVRAQEPEKNTGDTRDQFTVSGIRFEGLQRITEGTVLNQLPVNIGDVLTPQRVREALRAVYATGFFRDVELRREPPGELVIVVLERPSIQSFTVKGNKEIKTEDLTRMLRNAGLSTGKILSRAMLEEARQALTEQYHSHGRYAVRVDTTVEEQPGNLVVVSIDIKEGDRAKIRQINITGNERFDDKELLGELELKPTNLLSFYKGDDRYARESLEGDLERIKSYYLDRGYADFEITSTQVTITPEKQDLFVTVNVTEGKVWQVADVKLAGRFEVPEEELARYVFVKPGSQYSQRLITASVEAMRERLGVNGFAFAEITPVPVPNKESGEISLTFQVDPGTRTYVRRIVFQGVERTRDDVLRREMRQLEGAILSNSSLERSKQRLQRLPYVESVETETTRVQGTPDMVDIDVTVKEGPSASLGGGIGYSERQSVMLQGSYVDSNIFGSGERLALELNGGRYSKVFSVSHSDPYFTINGVSRVLSTSYIERERLTSSFSQFETKTWTAAANWGYPLSENQGVTYGLSYSHEDLATLASSSLQLRNWVRENGDSYFRRVGRDAVLGTQIDLVDLTIGWYFDSRNRTLFPTSGASYRATFGVTPPGMDISYMSANLRAQQYFKIGLPLIDKLTFLVSADMGWARGIGDTTAVPPHRHTFIGGADSVRGFRDGTLGPRDSLGNPYGGDAGFAAQFEAILPMPKKFATSARVSAFFDIGQAFYLGDTGFRDPRGNRTHYKFDVNEFRSSVGLAVQWLSPMGLFRFSYAQPLQYQERTRREFGDDIERFQFTVGHAF